MPITLSGGEGDFILQIMGHLQFPDNEYLVLIKSNL